MANLKDIRTRINSVKTTRQVTSAMKMVSAAKFKKAQDDITHIRPYVEKLAAIIFHLANSLEENIQFDLAELRDPNRILIVPIASNRGLCGAFNINIVKRTEELIKNLFFAQNKNGAVDIIAIGKQAQKLLRSHGYHVINDFNEYYTSPSFSHAETIAETFMNAFTTKKYDRVILVYNEFLNAAQQNVKTEQLLPLELPYSDDAVAQQNYIIEPDLATIISSVIPNALKTMFYKVLLESLASEHGARMTSMHKATDNASDLIGELQLQYNKARQGAITTEILEIVGGAEALRK